MNCQNCIILSRGIFPRNYPICEDIFPSLICSGSERTLIGLLVRKTSSGLLKLYCTCGGEIFKKCSFLWLETFFTNQSEKIFQFWWKKWQVRYTFTLSVQETNLRENESFEKMIILDQTGIRPKIMILWQTNINKLTKLHISVPAAFWDEHFSWRKRNFCKFFEFCGKESRQACQKFLLLTVGTFREFTFAGKTKKFFLNVFLIWAGTHQTFDEIKFAGAEVVGLRISNSKIRPEEWKRRIFFS